MLLNVLDYYGPLREQVKRGIEAGFIRQQNLELLTFVDGPEDHDQHADFDWGSAAIQFLDEWKPTGWKGFGFDWTQRSTGVATPLSSV